MNTSLPLVEVGIAVVSQFIDLSKAANRKDPTCRCDGVQEERRRDPEVGRLDPGYRYTPQTLRRALQIPRCYASTRRLMALSGIVWMWHFAIQ